MCVCVAIAFRKDVSRCSGSTLTNPVDIKPVQSISSRSAGGQELVVNNNKLLNPIDVPKIHSPLEKGVWPAPSLVTIISQFNIKGMPGNLKNSVQVKHIHCDLMEVLLRTFPIVCLACWRHGRND